MEVAHFEMRMTALWKAPQIRTPYHLLATVRTVPYPRPGWHTGGLHAGEDWAAFVLHMGYPLGTVVLV